MRLAWGLLACVMLCACLDRAVVGTQLDGHIEQMPSCTSPPECSMLDDVPKPSERPPQDFGDLAEAECGAVSEPIVIDAVESGSREGITALCGELAIQIAEGVELELRDVDLDSVHVVVHAGRGGLLRISQGTITRAHVDLDANARVVADGVTFEKTIFAVAPDNVERALELTNDVLRRVVVTAGDRAEVHLVGGEVTKLNVVTGSLISERNEIHDAWIGAVDAIVAGGALAHTEVHAERLALYAAYLKGNSSVFDCGRLEGVDATIVDSHVDGCTQGMDLETSDIRGSTVLGDVELFEGTLSSTVFAADPHGLVLDGVQVDGIALCGTRHVVDRISTLACVACEPDLEIFDYEGGPIEHPDCPALEAVAATLL